MPLLLGYPAHLTLSAIGIGCFILMELPWIRDIRFLQFVCGGILTIPLAFWMAWAFFVRTSESAFAIGILLTLIAIKISKSGIGDEKPQKKLPSSVALARVQKEIRKRHAPHKARRTTSHVSENDF